jgi:hypothetical protein
VLFQLCEENTLSQTIEKLVKEAEGLARDGVRVNLNWDLTGIYKTYGGVQLVRLEIEWIRLLASLWMFWKSWNASLRFVLHWHSVATYFRFYLEINASRNNSREQQKLLKISVQFKKWLFVRLVDMEKISILKTGFKKWNLTEWVVLLLVKRCSWCETRPQWNNGITISNFMGLKPIKTRQNIQMYRPFCRKNWIY